MRSSQYEQDRHKGASRHRGPRLETGKLNAAFFILAITLGPHDHHDRNETRRGRRSHRAAYRRHDQGPRAHQRPDFLSRPRAADRKQRPVGGIEISGLGAADARTYPPDCQRPDWRAHLRAGETRKRGLDRSLLLHPFFVQISSQHFPPARDPRHRHARDPNVIPNFDDLKLPPQLAEVVHLRNGIVLVTGPTGSGKSSTLAAIIDRANSERAIHILSIEDPIEFCHNHKKATIHQRELYSDTPTFALALRTALRQAPKIIFVGEMRDKETIEIALEAAETGHLVLSTLHTIDASKTVERIVGVFPLSDQQTIRNRFARAFRFIISQRLLPRREGKGRVAVLEILKSTMRTREYIEKGEGEGKSLVDAMTDGSQEGMQHFDGELERLIRAGLVEMETGLSYASNAGNLRLCLVDYIDEAAAAAETAAAATANEPAAENVGTAS